MKTALFVVLTLAALHSSYGITISGTIKDSLGNGMEGVSVRLGKAGLSAATGSNGAFKLTDHSTVAALQPTHGDGYTVILKNNRLFFRASDESEIKAEVYDCKGKLLSASKKNITLKNTEITLPHFGSGVHIVRVFVDNEWNTFKSITGAMVSIHSAASGNDEALTKQEEMDGRVFSPRLGKAQSRIDDALLCTKTGYQLSRLAIANPDTSGLQITMIPLVTGTVTDGEGNAYQTVRIGNQEWTAENLRATKNNDGSSLGSGYHFYNNATDAAAKKKWGALYTFDAVKSGKLAPKGWHVSTRAEWDTLENYLITHGYNYDGSVTGNKIGKSMASKTDWPADSSDTGAIGNDASKNNACGFSAIPAGYRYYDGTFQDQGNISYFWTATERDASYAWYRYLWYVDPQLSEGYRVKSIECPVRLVKDK